MPAIMLVAALLVACGKGISPGGEMVGEETSPDNAVLISGAAQKGPFVKGTRILINRLDKRGESTYETSVSYIQDDLGNFAFPVKGTGPILIEADGINFNEVTGQLSKSRLQLRALYNVTREAKQRSYINVLTHLAYKRILKLIRQGVDVNEAIGMGQAAVVASFQGIFSKTDVVAFSKLSLFDGGADEQLGNAFLLSVSAALSQYVLDRQLAAGGDNFDAQVAFTLNVLADDIAENGRLENQGVIAGLKVAVTELALDKIKKGLESRGFSGGQNALSVADMNLVIDTDDDGIVNKEDPDDDNDGIPDDADASSYTYSETPTLNRQGDALSFPTRTDVSLEWLVSKYAVRIEMQQSTAADFPLGAKTTSLTGKTISTRFELAGTYYLRARAGSASGVWGPWGDALRVSAGTYVKALGDAANFDYGSIRATRDGGILVSRLDDFSSVTKLDSRGRTLWGYKSGSPEASFDVRGVVELVSGILVFPAFIALGPDGKFLWGKTIGSPGDRVSDLTNLVELDGALYVIYSGQHCEVDGCVPVSPVPTLLTIDPSTGATIASVTLPTLDTLFPQIPTEYQVLLPQPPLFGVTYSDARQPPLYDSSYLNRFPMGATEPAWSTIFSLMVTLRKQLVVTFTADWFRHACGFYTPRACANFGMLGVLKDGTVAWSWEEDEVSALEQAVRSRSHFPGYGWLYLGGRWRNAEYEVENPVRDYVNENGLGLLPSDIPPGPPGANFDLQTGTWDRSVSGEKLGQDMVVTILNRTSQTVKRVRFPCADKFECSLVSFDETADGGVVVLYEQRESSGSPSVAIVAKLGVNGSRHERVFASQEAG